MMKELKGLKSLVFGLGCVLPVILAIATLMEKMFGTDFARDHIYTSVWFVAIWGALALLSLLYLLKVKIYRRPYTCLLHLSFLLILAGACTSWLSGKQGTIHLRKGISEQCFQTTDGRLETLPFAISLQQFEVVYYTGTQAPMDFVSCIQVSQSGKPGQEGKVSMNHIFEYMNYRFYQSGYDADGEGTRFSVSHDPYGIALTYTGYGLLLLSMVLFFFDRNSSFRQLCHHPLLKRGAICLLFCCGGGAFAANTPSIGETPLPKALPMEQAECFADLYTLYNNRICPVQTVAHDFTVKLTGHTNYRGLNAEQVFTGLLFFTDSWQEQPLIRVKSRSVRNLLGIKGQYASLKDYVNASGEYKLADRLNRIHNGEQVEDKRGVEEADEKYNLVLSLVSGEMLKLFPYSADKAQAMSWFAPADKLPDEIAAAEAMFIRKSMSLVTELAIMKRYDDLNRVLAKIKTYQEQRAGDSLPSHARIEAEKCYNTLNYTKPMAMACIILGMLTFFFFLRTWIKQSGIAKRLTLCLVGFLLIPLAYLTLTLTLRTYISGHLPLSNGYETMQFMAWIILLLTLVWHRRFGLILPFGFLLCGLTLLVSMFGETNPQITQLMPVLVSPLLSIHVAVIMLAYALLAFMMLNGVTALVLRVVGNNPTQQLVQLQVMSRLMLYPAVFLLTVGIFVGAVWANVSWGRYWGWDPKEVWALITLLVYSFALHERSLAAFRRPLFFHVYMIVAFFSVLITYFGVNFLLGGMHSYAG